MGPGSFGSVLEANYHARIPFFDGTVAEAQRLAQEAAQFLVVYLHCPTHEDSSDFITKVLGQEEVVAQLTQSAVLVGISVAEWEGHQLAQQLSITTYPAVAVYLKRELVMRTMGLCTKEDFLLDWRAMMDVWGGVHAEEIAWRTDREARISSQFTVDAHREEMEETDRRLLAEMEAERQRAEARIAEEKLLEEQAAHAKREEEVRAAAEAERQAHELHLRKCRQTEAAQRLPPPPPEDADRSAIVHIALKSITGKTHERTFWRTDSVDALMDLVLSLDESCDAVDLVCGFPPAPLTWEVGCTTFSDLRQLCPRAVVQIRRRAK